MEDVIEYILQNKEVSAIILKQDLRLFIKYTHFAINNSEFIFKPFHLQIIEKLQNIALNKNEKRNLAISVPVGSGKSLIIEYFIAWTKCRDKNSMDCYISHSMPNITKLSREVKSMFEHEFLQQLYGLRLKKDERAKINWSFDGAYNRSGLRAASMGTGFTGADAGNPNIQGYSGALIIDDPMDAEHIKSELKRNDVIERYKSKLETRRRTTTTPSIVIMQRLHEDDLIGYLYKNEPHLWDFVKIKAVDDNCNSFWEERYPIEDLLLMKEKKPFLFYSQYQQEPQMLDGIYVKREYFRYEPHRITLQRNYDAVYICCDTANKDKKIHDPSALLVWGVWNNSFYLIDMICERMLFPELLKAMQQLIYKYNPQTLLIEDRSSGTNAVSILKSNGINNVNIIPLPATQEKGIRLNAALDSIQAGRLTIPEDTPWTHDYVQEMISFPNAKHDDMVDSTSHFINWYNERSAKFSNRLQNLTVIADELESQDVKPGQEINNEGYYY